MNEHENASDEVAEILKRGYASTPDEGFAAGLLERLRGELPAARDRSARLAWCVAIAASVALVFAVSAAIYWHQQIPIAGDAVIANEISIGDKRTEPQQIAQQAALIEALNGQINILMKELRQLRPRADYAMLRQAAGYITRVPGDNTVYINLGIGDHVIDGMTFEVYDAKDGIPSTANNDVLPVGKGSIELISLGQNGSKCRIIKQEPGTQFAEGDIIANLVYDKNTTYNFMVYGNFDVAHTGTPKPEDADVIKRLVTTWGGKLSDKVTIDTDFLVLGEEPTLPPPPDPDDADAKAKYEKALADQKAWQDVLGAAKDLSIPVLNQNRFLYFVGYYDRSEK